ncbi:hypothetical protein B0J18DRAFT_424083 [Chaetomium sp. MPI-SDFR-AT-0129]|nr:hypothetical protein B0J18DRAFT_424083 [Chaetomium sp. MPI-SDFR-AT-0129]
MGIVFRACWHVLSLCLYYLLFGRQVVGHRLRLRSWSSRLGMATGMEFGVYLCSGMAHGHVLITFPTKQSMEACHFCSQ